MGPDRPGAAVLLPEQQKYVYSQCKTSKVTQKVTDTEKACGYLCEMEDMVNQEALT